MDTPDRKKSLPVPPIPKEYLEKWDRLIRMITTHTTLPAIVITRIEDGRVTNIVSTSHEQKLAVGSTVALEKSLCKKVLESKKAVFFPGNPQRSSYSGYPIFLPNGEVFGTVCLFDVEEASQDDLVKEITWFIEVDLVQLVKRNDLEGYERVIEAVHDPVSIVDKDLRYVVVNRAYEEHFGVNQRDFFGTPVEWYFHPEDYIGLVKPYLKLCLQGERVTYSAWMSFAETRRYMDVTYSPLYQEGEVEGVVVTARDLTSIKKIEDSLSKAENDIAYSLASAEDVVIIVGKDFVIQEVNEAGLELLMKEREEVVGEKCYRLFHGNDYPARHCPILKSLISGTEEVMERYEPIFDSYYSIKCTPVKDDFGKIEKFIHSIKDVSDKAEPQRALALSEANLRAILNTTFISYILLDLEGRIREFNPIAGMRMLEITGSFLEKGKSIFEYIPNPLRTNFKKYFLSAVSGVPLKTERGLETNEGTQQWYEFDFIPVQNEGEEVTGVVISGTDITVRTLSEAKKTVSLKEKDHLLGEIHHRVKNNLQIISSLLNLQSGFTETAKDQEGILKCSTRVNALAIVYEHLYREGLPEEIETLGYMEAILQYIYGSCCGKTEKIRLIKDLSEARISLDSAIPLGLMINELVSNALFHGFSNGDSGYIRMTFSETSPSLIADSKREMTGGSGEAEKTRKRYSLIVENRGGKPPGKSLEKIEKKLGLTLTEALVQQLEGSISYEGYEDGLKTTVFCTLF